MATIAPTPRKALNFGDDIHSPILKRIVLAWQSKKGERRFLVADIFREDKGCCRFSYRQDEVEVAKKLGFRGYPEISDLNATDVIVPVRIFSRRLPPFGRTDTPSYYEFWGIGKDYDDFDKLGLTQAILPTDFFEFIGMPEALAGMRFVTDVAGGVHFKLDVRFDVNQPPDVVLSPEPENAYDRFAVKILLAQTPVGYLKRGHNEVYHEAVKAGLNVKTSLHRIVSFPTHQKFYVKIEM